MDEGPRLAVYLVPRQKTCPQLRLRAGDGYGNVVVMRDILGAVADSAPISIPPANTVPILPLTSFVMYSLPQSTGRMCFVLR